MDELGGPGEQLVALDMKDAILVDSIHFGKGAVFITAHECEEPSHAVDSSINIIALVAKDVNGNLHTLVMPKDGDAARGLVNLEVYYSLRRLMES